MKEQQSGIVSCLQCIIPVSVRVRAGPASLVLPEMSWLGRVGLFSELPPHREPLSLLRHLIIQILAAN